MKKDLGKYLDQVEERFHRTQFLSSDPLEFVHHYFDPWDQEAIALLAALLAYGNVRQIRKSISEALVRMGKLSPSPSEFVRKMTQPKFQAKAHQVFDGYVHRFNQGSDIVWLFELLSKSWEKHGSLGSHFLTFLNPGDETIGNALDQLIQEWRIWLGSERIQTSFSYLLTSPRDGSCCKRWCMFLRWMGRQDALDPGLWMAKSPLATTFPKGRSLFSHQLVMPLDTHTGRISKNLGLTSRKNMNWKAAIEVTEALRKLDPKDPIRYDFALARVGILKERQNVRN